MEALDAKLCVSIGEEKNLQGSLTQVRSSMQRIEDGTMRLIPQPRLSYFVLNILDHCNLRCKGCDHFACIAEERFIALEDICNDVTRMAELTGGCVTRIGVMGGEPLLHPDLIEILKATREAFPSTVIHLVTNGLLLLQMHDSFWSCCHENDITIVNTKYPIHLDYERIQERAAEYNVKFQFYGTTGTTQKTSYKMPLDINGGQNPTRSFYQCYLANDKPLLMEGKLYPCTIAPNVRHFNKKFGTHMELAPGDCLDIYRVESYDEILQFLAASKPFCRFCIPGKRSKGLPWERSKQEMSEWLLESPKA